MAHFWPFDWPLDQMRALLVHVDFHRNGKCVLSTVAMAGYVGLFQSVKQNLSASLNFRPIAETGSKLARKLHPMTTIFGKRATLGEHMRHILLDPDSTLTSATGYLSALLRTARAYIMLSDGYTTSCVTRDFAGCGTRSSHHFIAVANHDPKMEHWCEKEHQQWIQTLPPALRNRPEHLRRGTLARQRCITERVKNAEGSVLEEQLWEWMQQPPLTNSETFLGIIMDPVAGTILRENIHLVAPGGNGSRPCNVQAVLIEA